MKRTAIHILLFIIPYIVQSQTIINAESLISGKDSTIFASSLSYAGNRGNIRTDQIDIAPSIVIIRKKNEYRFLGSYNMLSQSGNKLLNGGYVHLRHNYKILNRIKTFEFYQIQFNEILILQKRELYGVGLRFDFIDKDSLKTRFSFGIMREKELLDKTKLQSNETEKTDYYRFNSILTFKYLPGNKFSIDNVLYYQPYLMNFSDYRILNDLRISSFISDHLSLIITFNIRYDSDPPKVLEKIDYSVNFGINLRF